MRRSDLTAEQQVEICGLGAAALGFWIVVAVAGAALLGVGFAAGGLLGLGAALGLIGGYLLATLWATRRKVGD